MNKDCCFQFLVLIGLLLPNSLQAQTPFSASWSFEGNSNGTSSSGFVTASDATYNGVNALAVNPYTSGYNGLSVNIQNWSTSLCNQTEYVQFSVQPVGTATLTLTNLSFAFARSAQGPQQISVRSSVDNFSRDLHSQMVSTTFQVATIPLNGSGFIDQPSPVIFRIYACNPTAGGGTLRLDDIQINATALPVTLLTFTAKPEGDRVQLAWSTSSEYQADRFVVERSMDLNEFVGVGDVKANGTTDNRQYYNLTDLNPRPGINYYRLKQVDRNGMVQYFKPVSALIRVSDPVVSVYPNPGSGDRIHVRLWSADSAVVRLLSITGQVMDGVLVQAPGEAEFRPAHSLPVGLFYLEVLVGTERRTVPVLVR